MMSKEVGMSRKSGSQRGTPAGTKGARRATGESAGGGLAPGQRWSAGRKREVVLRVLRGESLDALSRELGVEIYRLEEWRDKALSGLDAGLKDRQDDPLSRELDVAKRHIGELSMEIELLRTRSRAAEAKLPLATRRSRR
jgi:transposase